MTTALTVASRNVTSWNYVNTDGLGLETPDKQTYETQALLTNGAGSGQANKVFRVRGSVGTASQRDSYDLAGGIEDIFGNIISFTLIKELRLVNRSIVAGDDLNIGGSITGGINEIMGGSGTARLTVGPGVDSTHPGEFRVCSPRDGYSVSAGSADVVTVDYEGVSATISYDLIIIGVGS